MTRRRIGVSLVQTLPNQVLGVSAPPTLYDGRFRLAMAAGPQLGVKIRRWHYVRLGDEGLYTTQYDERLPAQPRRYAFCWRVARPEHQWLWQDLYLAHVGHDTAMPGLPDLRGLYVCGVCVHLIYRSEAGQPAEVVEPGEYVAELNARTFQAHTEKKAGASFPP